MNPAALASSNVPSTTRKDAAQSERKKSVFDTLTRAMPSSVRMSAVTRIKRVILLAGVAAALILAVQASAPLDGAPTAPAWFNFGGALALLMALAVRASAGPPAERGLAVACAICGVHFVLSVDLGADSKAELASSFSRLLSTTHWDMPVIALVDAWALVALGWLCGKMIVSVSRPDAEKATRIIAWAVGGAIAVFGVRGLIGYASGSVSLIAY